MSAHIIVPEGLPGIIGPMVAFPETAKYLNGLADNLLNQETPQFTKSERETVAAFVSYLNACVFCSESHAEVANAHLSQSGAAQAWWNKEKWINTPSKMRTMLLIAEKVQKDARTVSTQDIQEAKTWGLSDRDIHDIVLIAAAFCMFNRYVDGLGTLTPPRGDQGYVEMGKKLKQLGYMRAIES